MDNPVSRWGRIVLVILATLRATRFVTSDYLGHWTIVRPARLWAMRRTPALVERYPLLTDGTIPDDAHDVYDQLWDQVRPDEASKWTRLVKGLDCPFCVGFWIGALILLGEVATRTRPFRWARPLWTALLAVLALNEVVGHVSSRIDE